MVEEKNKEVEETRLADFQPVEDRLLVEIITPPSVSKGGVILPENAQLRSCQGRVVKVGPGRVFIHTGVRVPCECQVGDVVMFSRYGGCLVKDKITGKDYMILKESCDIFGRFTEPVEHLEDVPKY